jgi:hypothetical protein
LESIFGFKVADKIKSLEVGLHFPKHSASIFFRGGELTKMT